MYNKNIKKMFGDSQLVLDQRFTTCFGKLIYVYLSFFK